MKKVFASMAVIVTSIGGYMAWHAWIATSPRIYGKTLPQIMDIIDLVTKRFISYGGAHEALVFYSRLVVAETIILHMVTLGLLIPFWLKHRGCRKL